MEFSNKLKPLKIGPKNKGTFNNQRFWIGEINLLDGAIEETHSFEEAKKNDFHHSFYFSEPAQERIAREESAIFWIDDAGNIQGNWRTDLSPQVMARLKEQLQARK